MQSEKCPLHSSTQNGIQVNWTDWQHSPEEPLCFRRERVLLKHQIPYHLADISSAIQQFVVEIAEKLGRVTFRILLSGKPQGKIK